MSRVVVVVVAALASLALRAAEPSATPASPAASTASATPTSIGAPTRDAQQLVVVVTSSWTATTGRLQRHERTETGWRAVGAPIDVVVGNAGLGWGVGLHDFARGPGEPKKMEGDERAPAGVFRLTSALGKGGVPQTLMPKRTIKDGDVCVDDIASASYNRFVFVGEDGVAPQKTWASAEQMLRKRDALYDLVVVVDHNHAVDDAVQSKPIKGVGSCVFLHVWRRPGSPTVGCTAMSQAALVDVVQWLDPERQPLLVQLPRDIYSRVREPWALP